MKPYYVTTPIYYVNGAPHIGHVYTTLLADAVHRYQTLTGRKSIMQTGTDEHGQKVQQTAEAKGVAPQQWCDQLCHTFKTCFDVFGFEPTRFIRTTDLDHVAAATHLWRTLAEAGHIYKAKYSGWYCVSDETFVPEKDTHMVQKGEEEIRVSVESGQPVSWVEEENYMFRLSSFEQPLIDYYESHPGVIVPAFRQAEVLKFIRGGLRDISISRSASKIHWGIPVPDDEEHVMYVWIDALTNYLTGAGYPGAPTGWPADVHLLGKDIMRFHCVYWPAFLLGASIPLPKLWFVHGWWMVGDRKIGKSLGNAFDPVEIATELGVDVLRYYLLREGTPENDSSVTRDAIVLKLNSDLANGLGNLLLRCWATSLCPSRQWPEPAFDRADMATVPEEAQELVAATNRLHDQVSVAMREIRTARALESIMGVVTQINAYLQSTAPWKLVKLEKAGDEAAGASRRNIIYLASECLRIVGTLLQPFMPDRMARLLTQLGVPEDFRAIDASTLLVGRGVPGTPLGPKQDILFPKMKLGDKEEVKVVKKPKQKKQKKSKKKAQKPEPVPKAVAEPVAPVEAPVEAPLPEPETK
eukprot:gnl/Dysnectes_brevis/1143_a1277_3353.p1 GENE.gnl/Dysnectes_brevis/1143_a1277_3353~~gnl/Dysnectes_brevis/1143_a1277_3353.p1  ORF type:complete len:582 (+),score=191.17 gnl/Dysnectes_brevis/1143_a1277_3353:143-1888(+)